MAKRYIDADALMATIRQHDYRLATKLGSVDDGMFTLGIQQAVDEQPDEDVAPVVHGRWIAKTYKDFQGHGFAYLDCSECRSVSPEDKRHKFCPACGALMDAEEGRA